VVLYPPETAGPAAAGRRSFTGSTAFSAIVTTAISSYLSQMLQIPGPATLVKAKQFQNKQQQNPQQ